MAHSAHRTKILADNISEPQFELLVGGEQWTRVASFDGCGSHDPVYRIEIIDGEATVRFGDGKQGRKLPAGSSIQATYTHGLGADGNMGDEPTISLTWTSTSSHKNEVIGAIIELQADRIIFRLCRESEVPDKWKWGETLSTIIKRWALRLIYRLSRPR